MFRLDSTFLERCRQSPEQASPRQCKSLAADCGELAQWILSPAALDRAAAEWQSRGATEQAAALRRRPQLPCPSGSCWVVFVVDRARYPLLREAFVLPLRWLRKESGESSATWAADLPAPLAREARNVLQVLHAFKTSGQRSQPTDWSLRLATSHPDLYDLDGLSEEAKASSGWAALAAGWLIASRGGRVDPLVWASARWTEAGLRPVGGLEAKLRLSAEHGVKRFFLAGSALEPALRALARSLGLTLEPLPEDTANPLEALRPLTRALAVHPELPADHLTWAGRAGAAKASFYEDATRYTYLLRNDLADPQGAAAFYRAVPLPAIVAECRHQVQQQQPALLHERGCLVTILSGSSELVELAVQVFRPRRCLILYTDQTAEAQEQLCKRVRSIQSDCSLGWVKIDRGMRPGRLPAEVSSFATPPDEPILIDLTPGTKLMTLALDHDLASLNGQRIYFMTEQRGAEIQLGTYQVVFV